MHGVIDVYSGINLIYATETCVMFTDSILHAFEKINVYYDWINILKATEIKCAIKN